jgi:hypothetical protein
MGAIGSRVKKETDQLDLVEASKNIRKRRFRDSFSEYKLIFIGGEGVGKSVIPSS